MMARNFVWRVAVAACIVLLDGAVLVTGNAQQIPNDRLLQSDPRTSLVNESEEQNLGSTPAFDQRLLEGPVISGSYNDTYLGMKKFWDDDINGNLFGNIGQLLGRWSVEWTDGWVADTVGFLTGVLQAFVLNPNIAAQGSNDDASGDDISPAIRQGATIMQAIALDLLLILFLLAIWRYWTEAAWRNGEGVMGAIGRLIFTCGISLAWPTICYFEIRVSNEMIQAVCFNLTGSAPSLDQAMSDSVRQGLYSFSGAVLPGSFAPTLSHWGLNAAGIVVAGFVSSISVIVFFILGIILILQLILMLVMKAVQTALLVAQYLFAPVFLIFFATPDTENIASGFIRSCVEVSLWTFVWVGLLKIMSILLFSSFNPWGKIIMAIAIIQLMIQAPRFCAQANISPISQFISCGMAAQRFLQGATKLGSALVDGSMALAGTFSGRGQTSAITLPAGQTVTGISAGNSNLAINHKLNYPKQQSPPAITIEPPGLRPAKAELAVDSRAAECAVSEGALNSRKQCANGRYQKSLGISRQDSGRSGTVLVSWSDAHAHDRTPALPPAEAETGRIAGERILKPKSVDVLPFSVYAHANLSSREGREESGSITDPQSLLQVDGDPSEGSIVRRGPSRSSPGSECPHAKRSSSWTARLNSTENSEVDYSSRHSISPGQASVSEQQKQLHTPEASGHQQISSGHKTVDISESTCADWQNRSSSQEDKKALGNEPVSGQVDRTGTGILSEFPLRFVDATKLTTVENAQADKVEIGEISQRTAPVPGERALASLSPPDSRLSSEPGQTPGLSFSAHSMGAHDFPRSARRGYGHIPLVNVHFANRESQGPWHRGSKDPRLAPNLRGLRRDIGGQCHNYVPVKRVKARVHSSTPDFSGLAEPWRAPDFHPLQSVPRAKQRQR
jgi:hypothetical protein